MAESRWGCGCGDFLFGRSFVGVLLCNVVENIMSSLKSIARFVSMN